MFKPLLGFLSPAGASARLSILIFHRVLAQPDPLFPNEIDHTRFDAICGWLRAWFNVLPLDQAVQRLRDGHLPARAAAITFDDGYADNCEIALPVLSRHGLSATFFVATAFLDGGRMWNDTVIEAVRRATVDVLDLHGLPCAAPGRIALDTVPARRAAIGAVIDAVKYLEPTQREAMVQRIAERCRAALPADLMMSSEQVRTLHRAGMQIGAHTATHPILARLSAEQARHEIASGKQALESLLGQRVGLFAYPNGKPGQDYAPANVALVRELGFDAAVSTAPGAARQKSDLFQIPRFTPWDRSRLGFGARLVRNLMTA